MAKKPLNDASETEALAVKRARILVQAEGRTVLQEHGSAWPTEGIEDPGTLFTRRRLKDGDLVVAETLAAETQAAQTPAEGEAQ